MGIFVMPPTLWSEGYMEVTVYEMSYRGYDGGSLYSLDPFRSTSSITIGSGPEQGTYMADTSVNWTVRVPDGSCLEQVPGRSWPQLQLAWTLRGERTTSNGMDVIVLASLNLHGFSVVRRNQAGHA